MRSAAILCALLSASAADARTVELEVDAEARTLRIDDEVLGFMSPRLVAAPIDGGVRLFLDAGGPLYPERWIVHLEERNEAGAVVRRFRDVRFTGRGLLPLFIDFPVAAPPRGAFVAVLEVRARESDAAATGPVVLPAPGLRAVVDRPRRLGAIRAASVEEDVDALLIPIRRGLAVPSAEILVEGHWSSGPTARAEADALAGAVAAALSARGVPKERLQIVGRGADSPKVPSLSASLRKKNRRAEIVRLPPPPPPVPTTKLPAPDPRALDLFVGQKGARERLRTPARRWTRALEPPARLKAVLHDGDGGWATLVRGLGPSGVEAVGLPAEDLSSATPIPRPDVRIAGGRLALDAEGRRLELDLVAPDDVEQWRLFCVSTGTRAVTAEASGIGPPPPRLTLRLPATATRAATLELATRHAAGHRVYAAPVSVPALVGQPLATVAHGGEDLTAALAGLLDALEARPKSELVTVVDGGGPRARLAARAEVRAALAARGLSRDRAVWLAGRAEGRLTLSAHLEEAVGLRGPEPGYAPVVRWRGGPRAKMARITRGQVVAVGDAAQVVAPFVRAAEQASPGSAR